MTIDFEKPVRTRKGYRVRILCTDAAGEYPIVGLRATPQGDEKPMTWSETGHVRADGQMSDNDLLQVELEPFNLEYATKQPVVTRDGRSVRILCTDAKGSDQAVVGLIMHSSGIEECEVWTIEGKYYGATGNDSCNDLFLTED